MIRKNYPKVLPFSDLASFIEESTLALQKAESFLKRTNADPLLLFKEAHVYLTSEYNVLTAIMDTSYQKNKKVTPHSFQVYLGSLLGKALQTWASEQGISQKVQVLVRTPNTFPSIFAVYVNDIEVIQFNIFKKWYGMREKFLSEDEIKERAERSKQRYQEGIQDVEKKIEKWTKAKESPASLVKNLKGVYILLFKRKNAMANIDTLLKSFEKQKKELIKLIEEEDGRIPEQIKYQQLKEASVQLIVPFFKELNYSLEDQPYNLY